jgi:hypothetical protein
MSLYCTGAHIAAKVFKGNENDAGLIHCDLYDLLEELTLNIPDKEKEGEAFVKGICMAWERLTDQQVFGE